jgi:WD40 repeat protein
VKLWDLGTRREIATLKGHGSSVLSVVFSPDGKTLASGSSDHTVKLWDLGTRQEIATLKGHMDSVLSVVFSPDGKTLASGSSSFDYSIRLWQGATEEQVAAQR